MLKIHWWLVSDILISNFSVIFPQNFLENCAYGGVLSGNSLETVVISQNFGYSISNLGRCTIVTDRQFFKFATMQLTGYADFIRSYRIQHLNMLPWSNYSGMMYPSQCNVYVNYTASSNATMKCPDGWSFSDERRSIVDEVRLLPTYLLSQEAFNDTLLVNLIQNSI